MNRATYDDYVASFNARDYNAVLGFWADRFEVSFAGITLRSAEEFLRFYRFLHSYVSESIVVHDFVSNDRLVALRAEVRIEGRKELTAEDLNRAGYGGLFPIGAGQAMSIPQLILYHLENGKFVKVYCALL